MNNEVKKKVQWNLTSKQNLFIVCDIVFLAVGIASFVVGVWLYVDRNVFVELTPSSYSALSAAGLCCFTGATVAIISVVGLAGTWMNNKCLLITFIAFVILLGLIQSVTGIIGLFHKEEAKEHVRLDLLKNINRTYVMTRTGFKIEMSISWDQLQQSLQCCGADGPSDWFNSVKWPKNDFVPDSCCDVTKFQDVESMQNCGKVPTAQEHWFTQGCYPLFVDWLFHHIRVVNWLTIFLLISELMVLTAAIILYRKLSRMLEKKPRRTPAELNRLRLDEINERDREELHLEPMDRMGDANEYAPIPNDPQP